MPMRVHMRIKGHLDHSWQDWFEGLQIVHEAEGTSLLFGPLKDQAALYGVLWKTRQLSLALISLETDSWPQEKS